MTGPGRVGSESVWVGSGRVGSRKSDPRPSLKTWDFVLHLRDFVLGDFVPWHFVLGDFVQSRRFCPNTPRPKVVMYRSGPTPT